MPLLWFVVIIAIWAAITGSILDTAIYGTCVRCRKRPR